MGVSKWAYEPSKCDSTPCIGDCDFCPRAKEQTEYRYGMRLRGFAPGCQPKGVIERLDDTTGRYYDIITYDRPLTAAEIENYELDDLNEGRWK